MNNEDESVEILHITNKETIKHIIENLYDENQLDITYNTDNFEKIFINKSLNSALYDHINIELSGINSLAWINDVLDKFKIDIAYNIDKELYEFTNDDFYLPIDMQEVFYSKKIQRTHQIIYPYETEEFKIYRIRDREYEVYKNGRVFAKAFDRADSIGRIRHFTRKEIQPSQNKFGYWYLNIGGKKYKKRIFLHRLIAEAWLGNMANEDLEVNHKDGNKGNNSVENLEWVTRSENEIHKNQNDLNGLTKMSRYKRYKATIKYSLLDNEKIKKMKEDGYTYEQIIKLTNRSLSNVQGIIKNYGFTSEEHNLFEKCYCWEYTLLYLNMLLNEIKNNNDSHSLDKLIKNLPNNIKLKYIMNINYSQLLNLINYAEKSNDERWKQFYISAMQLPYVKEIRGL